MKIILTRTALLIFLFMTSTFASTPVVLGQDINVQNTNSVFTIRNVLVDKTAENATDARMLALDEGQRIAFQRLAERLLPENADNATLPDDATISALVESFEIEGEELSATRYIAKLIYIFNPKKSEEFFTQKTAVPVIKDVPEPVLLLPIMRFSDIHVGSVFWEDSNAWRNSWKDHDVKNNYIPILLPTGETADIQLAPEQSILQHHVPSIQQLIQKYHTASAVITVFEMDDMEMEHGLLHLYNFQDENITHVKTMEISRGDNDHIFQKAIEETVLHIENNWKKYLKDKRNALAEKASSTQHITANVIFQEIGEWITIQKMLNNSLAIGNMIVSSLDSNAAQVEIDYQGSSMQLQQALSEEGLRLYQPVPSLNQSQFNTSIYEIHLSQTTAQE